MNPREMTNSNIRKRAKGRKAVRTAEVLVNKQANKNRRRHMNKYAHRADEDQVETIMKSQRK